MPHELRVHAAFVLFAFLSGAVPLYATHSPKTKLSLISQSLLSVLSVKDCEVLFIAFI